MPDDHDGGDDDDEDNDEGKEYKSRETRRLVTWERRSVIPIFFPVRHSSVRSLVRPAVVIVIRHLDRHAVSVCMFCERRKCSFFFHPDSLHSCAFALRKLSFESIEKKQSPFFLASSVFNKRQSEN